MTATSQPVDLSTGDDDPLAGVVRTRERIRGGALSAVEAVTESLRRIESAEGASLNAFITVRAEEALAEAREADARRSDASRPLDGVPIAIKDNLATAGCRTTGGTTLFADWVPDRDAGVVRALREAGAIVVGKTNLHEAAFGITSKNPHYGFVRNPRRGDRIAGGSSGGSAAAVAAGMCPGSLGTDTGGSVRVPAALCGCVGYKPTIGRFGTDGLMSLSRTCDVIGPIAPTVEDVAAMAVAMAGGATTIAGRPPVAGVSGARIAVLGDSFADADPATARLVESFADRLRAGGATVAEAVVDGAERAMEAGFDIVLPESWTLVRGLLIEVRPGVRLEDHLDELGPDVRATLAGEFESPVPAQRYLRAMWQTRPALQTAFGEAFAGADFLLCATTPTAAVRHDEDPEMDFGGAKVPTFITFIRNCFAISVAGLPAISIPIGEADGLPVGAQIIARPGADDELLAFAAACEALLAR